MGARAFPPASGLPETFRHPINRYGNPKYPVARWFGFCLVSRMNKNVSCWIPGLLGLLLGAGGVVAEERYEGAPVYYSRTEATNRVTELAALFDTGELNGKMMSDREFLDFLLKHFGVSPASQVLVFSKTSLQIDLISPPTPRAIYFGPDAYIGWVPGGLMEMAIQDPKLGMVFYRIHPPRLGTPSFIRDEDCLSCHGGSRSLSVPGVMIRSVFPDEDGHPIGSAGSFNVHHDTPISQRWGGWYVTGEHGEMPHMGNRIAEETPEGRVVMRSGDFLNLTRLDDLVPTRAFPSPGSDIVALMVLEHQVRMHNLLNRATLETRLALHREAVMDEFFGDTSDTYSDTTERILDRQAEEVVDYLLFRDEAPLPEDGITGDPAFTKAFRKMARDDRDGRSLRDFQLVDRLFKHRCSYMIYSQAFQDMPAEVKERVWKRLHDVLTAPEPPETLAYLSELERQRIHQILADTLAGLPEYW